MNCKKSEMLLFVFICIFCFVIFQNVNDTKLAIKRSNLSKIDNVEIKSKEIIKKDFVYFEEIPLSYDDQVMIYNVSREQGVDYKLILAMMKVESGYNTDVRSVTNDTGIMQINDCNISRLNNTFDRELNLYNIYDNTISGVLMISEKLQYTSNDISMALMCYNMGNYGAQKYFDNGIYESSYSIKVNSEYDYIKELYNERCYIQKEVY